MYAVICIKSYPAVKRAAESFSIEARHEMIPDKGPEGDEKGTLTYARKTWNSLDDNYKQAIATPEAMNAAQNNNVV